MSVLEFTEVLASQLINNCHDDLNIKDNDPDQLPFTDSESTSTPEDYNINGL